MTAALYELDGELTGWRITTVEGERPARNGRALLLQVARLATGQRDDEEALRRLLWHEADGRPLWQHLCDQLGSRAIELERRRVDPSSWERAEAEGYQLLWLEVDHLTRQAVARWGDYAWSERRGRRTHVIWAWGLETPAPEGAPQELVFEQHAFVRLLWREVPAEELAGELEQDLDEAEAKRRAWLAAREAEIRGGASCGGSPGALPGQAGVECVPRAADVPPVETANAGELQGGRREGAGEPASGDGAPSPAPPEASPPGGTPDPDHALPPGVEAWREWRGLSLLETLERLGYTHEPAEHYAKRILGDGAEVYRGTAGQVWDWLRETGALPPSPFTVGGLWRDLLERGAWVHAPEGSFCSGCAGALDPLAELGTVLALRKPLPGGQGTYLADLCHRACAESLQEDEERKAIEREARQAEEVDSSDAAPDASIEELLARPVVAALIERSRKCRAYKARHKGEENPACLLCLQAIEPGQKARKKRPGSGKAMHEACRLRALEIHGAAASAAKETV